MSKPLSTRNQNQRSPKKRNRSQRRAQANPKARQLRVAKPATRVTHFRLSECATAYARAQLDPFSAGLREHLPCIPDVRAVPSMKFSTLTRGTVRVGTAGYGYLVLSPMAKGNDTDMALVTGATFTGTDVPTVVATGVVAHRDIHFPWAAATTVSPKTRLVGCGMRVRYIGTELNRGGTITKLAYGDFTPTAGMTYASIASLQEVKIEQVDRQWHLVAFRPTVDVLSEYANTTAYGVGATYSPVLIVVQGESGNAFEFEIIRYFEAVSSAVTAVIGLSKSDSDLMGMSALRDYVSSILPADAGDQAWRAFSSYLQGTVAKTMSGLVLGPGANALPALGWVR